MSKMVRLIFGIYLIYFVWLIIPFQILLAIWYRKFQAEKERDFYKQQILLEKHKMLLFQKIDEEWEKNE